MAGGPRRKTRRHERISGDHLQTRKLFGQQADGAIGIAVINRMIDARRSDRVRIT
jgi:hypothetical protein